MRLCGLSAQHRKALEDSRLIRRFPAYHDKQEAVRDDSRKPRRVARPGTRHAPRDARPHAEREE